MLLSAEFGSQIVGFHPGYALATHASLNDHFVHERLAHVLAQCIMAMLSLHALVSSVAWVCAGMAKALQHALLHVVYIERPTAGHDLAWHQSVGWLTASCLVVLPRV